MDIGGYSLVLARITSINQLVDQIQRNRCGSVKIKPHNRRTAEPFLYLRRI